MRPQSEWTRVLAAVFIGAGLLLLGLRQFAWQLSGSLWPFTVIVPGAALFAVGATMGRTGKYFAVTGAVIGGTGLILLAQDLTSYYQSWAYLWTLLPVFAGASLYVTSRRDGEEGALRFARALMLSGAVMFVVFAAAFEGLIFHATTLGGSILLPIALILLGVALLFRLPGSGSRPGGPSTGSSGPKPAQS